MYRVIWSYYSHVLGPLASELLADAPLVAGGPLFADFDLVGIPEPVFHRPPLALRAELLAVGFQDDEEVDELGLDLASFHHVFTHDLETAERLRQRLDAETTVQGAEIQARPEPAIERTLAARPHPRRSAFLTLTPTPTPPFETCQRYLEAAPDGIGARAAWNRPGGTGEGVRILDIEYGWNFAHEDLLEKQIGVLQGVNAGSDHGTAVLGILSGDRNAHGVTGIVPDTMTGAVSADYDFEHQRWNAAASIELAMRFLGPGDVIVLEMHAPGPHSTGSGQVGFLPVEYWRAEHAAIRLAVARGVYVVEAAGNGGEDLDHPDYGGGLSRAADSGAILVGGGASPWQSSPRSRLSWSNYGSRLDLQGWGSDIVTTGGREPGYHDLLDHPESSRCYTQSFGGTSGATPIVAGAAAAVTGCLKASGRSPLPPGELRQLLVETATSQTDGATAPASELIGPLPNVDAALQRLGL